MFGRTNVGKSSFLNLICGQSVAITSPVPGTTTDVVEKTMELQPVGPVVFLDTAGVDDVSCLSALRIGKSEKIFDRADVILLIAEAGVWTAYEDEIVRKAKERRAPVIAVINKIDLKYPSEDFLRKINAEVTRSFACSSLDLAKRDNYVNALKKNLIEVCPDDFINPPSLLGDLLPPAGLVVMIAPIDLQAPRGRLILPQVQAIRDALDNDAAALVVKEKEYAHFLGNLKNPPDLVVCDSQAVLKMVADTPENVKCTTFSILSWRYKADLAEAVRGLSAIDGLKAADRVLIAEACSHHAIEDDIGRVKIPRWLRQYLGVDVKIDVCSGHDYPKDLKGYKLVIHCGGCMLARREMLSRIQRAQEEGVAITNYGLCIAYLQGVLERVLSAFPAAMEVISK